MPVRSCSSDQGGHDHLAVNPCCTWIMGPLQRGWADARSSALRSTIVWLLLAEQWLLLACCYVFRGETVRHLAAICWHCRLSRLLRVWSVSSSKQSRCHGTKLLLQARASIPCSECCVLPREEIYATCLGLCRVSITALSRK
jgi:hypothetical protein